MLPLDHPMPAIKELAPLIGKKTRDAALRKPRIRAGEIIGWRIWNLCNGLLHSVFRSTRLASQSN